MSLLVAIQGWSPDDWVRRFRQEPGSPPVLDAREPFDPAAVRYAACWKTPPGLLARLPNLQAIFNLGAGVDALLADPTLPAVPLVRVADPDLTARMTEYVVLHVLRHHRRVDLYAEAQARREWLKRDQPPARAARVGIMGMGVLGRDAAGVLARIGFRVAGWSRRGDPVPGVEIYAGAEGLKPFLARTDILVALLPLTPDTRGILNHELCAGLAQDGPLGGPALINAGRGGLQVAADILRALDEGHLAHATLDVFETEPLPATSPLWTHPKVTVTPHNAADSEPAELCRYVVEQIRRHEAGGALQNVVDRGSGY
ncbi:2-hydroxyacid dehydrogenase [Prosthecomicrobium sp. N25]|uniref:2-hydroxyacid dehydrogenase n=1 Tax=Prosthecomicrobium sp. N25 TaxID=3129254 RepID=UPI003076D7AF